MIYIEERSAKKLPGITTFFVKFDFKKEIVDVLKSFDCRNYNEKTNEWEFSLVYLSRLIESLNPIDDISLKFIDTKEKPEIIYKLSKYKTNPYDYQKEAIQYGLNHANWLLLDDPGLGKSLELIYIAQELKKRENIKHCLIICGINNLKANWRKEILKHSDLDCMILGQKINKKGELHIGSVADRCEQLNKKIKEFFIITNIETLRDEKVLKLLKKNKNSIDMIVVDEIHTTKNPSSQQGKHLLKLNDAKYKIGMTGTLLLNNPLDVYVPLKWLGLEKSNYTTFKYHYCSYGGHFHNILLGFKNTDLLKYQLSQCSLRRTKDILGLPPKTVINEIVEMDNKQSKFYNDIKSGIIDEVDKVHMSTASLLSMVSRLRQATALPSILTSENIISAKVERAKQLCDEIISTGNKVVIFSTFKDTANYLNDYLKEYAPLLCTGDVDDEIISKNIDNFQRNPDNKIFIATWQKCGTGITLTAASYMIFIDTPWTSGVFTQACDRIYRVGTKDPVFIYNLITKDTIDERVQEILDDKKALSEYIIDDQLTDSNINSLKKYIENLEKS